MMTYRRFLRLLLRDVDVTLGRSGLQLALSFIHDDRALGNAQKEYPDDLVSRLQTYIHDEFVDTTWPACPKHPNHPLWFGRDDSWWCGQSGERVAALGELPAPQGPHHVPRLL